MSPRRTHLLAWLLIGGLIPALCSVSAPPLPALAQQVTPETSEAQTRTPGPTPSGTGTPTTQTTPTVTRTPTMTPTATATFTVLQARLALGQTYLNAGDYTKAAEIFAAVALEDHGNPEALRGLDDALRAGVAATATAAAPSPTVASPTPAPSGPAFVSAFAAKWNVFSATALAALLIVLLVYLVARALRWLLSYVRELWFTHVRRPPIRPSFLIGGFVNATGDEEFQGPSIVAQALTGQLLGWNDAVPPALQNPVQADGLAGAGMASIAALWHQVFPPRRAYKITGVLLGKQPGPYRLSIDRIDLRTLKVDASHTFEGSADTPGQAFRELAMTAAFWLRDPSGMDSTPGMLETPARVPGLTGVVKTPAPPTPTQLASEALRPLGLVRRQVIFGAVDYSVAPRLLDEAQALVEQLPANSSLRQDLQSAIDHLWRSVQPGRGQG